VHRWKRLIGSLYYSHIASSDPAPETILLDSALACFVCCHGILNVNGHWVGPFKKWFARAKLDASELEVHKPYLGGISVLCGSVTN